MIMDKKDFKILVVDDEPSSVELIGDYLSTVGFQVEYALSGEEALQKSERSAYHLFIIDIYLPKMDGMELLEKLDIKSKAAEAVLITGQESLQNLRHFTFNQAFHGYPRRGHPASQG
jgi:CheY-like chemotaxis protein